MKKLVDQYLDIIIEHNGSDIIFTVWEPPVVRINTQLERFTDFNILDDNTLKQLASDFISSSNKQNQNIEKEHSIDMSYTYNNRYFRVNISRQRGTIMIVARLLMNYIPDLDTLENWYVFNSLIKRPSGIILVAWPTWSWKSTLLASMIDKINKTYKKHIISIEDPIEYVYKSDKSIIEQKELWTDLSSFAEWLKSSLRQNPDIILFGEMRDPESIKNAITLAETGHLVLSTIHSKSSAQTISKIVDSFPANQQEQIRYQLSETLVAVISQRILKTEKTKDLLFPQEIMVNNSAISNCIKKNDIKSIHSSILTGKDYWMQLLDTSLIKLVEEDLIDINTALENANNPWYIRDVFDV